MESISGNILGEEENNNISTKKFFCCDGKIKEQSEEDKNKNNFNIVLLVHQKVGGSTENCSRSCGLYSTTFTTY